MFKKFTVEENLTSQTQAKSSVARGIRSKVLKQYPKLEPVIDELFPKKAPLVVAKCRDYITLVVVNKKILFFENRDLFYPTLRLLHMYPGMLPVFQVDRGAIKFVLSGANIMCPGLTSAGGKMDDVGADTIVAIHAEGKRHALAIGFTKLSTEEILKVNKGVGVENIHYLNDGLWSVEDLL